VAPKLFPRGSKVAAIVRDRAAHDAPEGHAVVKTFPTFAHA